MVIRTKHIFDIFNKCISFLSTEITTVLLILIIFCDILIEIHSIKRGIYNMYFEQFKLGAKTQIEPASIAKL